MKPEMNLLEGVVYKAAPAPFLGSVGLPRPDRLHAAHRGGPGSRLPWVLFPPPFLERPGLVCPSEYGREGRRVSMSRFWEGVTQPNQAAGAACYSTFRLERSFSWTAAAGECLRSRTPGVALEGVGRSCCFSGGRRGSSLSLPAGRADVGFHSPPTPATPALLPAIAASVLLLTCGQTPRGRVLIPTLPWATLSASPLAPCAPWLPQQLEETLSGLLPRLALPTEIPGCLLPPGRWLPAGPLCPAPSCPGRALLPQSQSLAFALLSVRSGGGGPHTPPHPGSQVESEDRNNLESQ